MQRNILVITIVLILTSVFCDTNQTICPGNRFIFLSTYVLGLQEDLTQAFLDITQNITIDQVVFRQQVYRSYKIYNVTHKLTYQQGKQYAQLVSPNVLMVTGGILKIQFSFNWQKIQLGSTLNGTGFGFVTSDVITYQKTLYTHQTHEIKWNLTKAQAFNITNGISIKTLNPYRASDQQVLSNMLNKLKDNQKTVKDHFLSQINRIYKPILAEKVKQNWPYNYSKTTPYTYRDYRGDFSFNFKNTLMNSTLTERGLYLLFSQVNTEDSSFVCGDVPNVPQDEKYGGLQEFISNDLLKSCLLYTIKKGSLNVVLNQQFWQSRAFQFFMGDLHDVMPLSTKKIRSLQQIKGGCNGLDDPVFSLNQKSDRSYQAKVNFACNLTFNNSLLISINMIANYEVQPTLSAKKLDFILTGIVGVPQFVQTDPFKIQYPQLAEFMVAETLALAKGGTVIGSNYKTVNRKYAQSLVRKNYLFLYDSSLQGGNIYEKQTEVQ